MRMISLLQHRKSCLVQKEEKKAKADCKRWQTGALVPLVVGAAAAPEDRPSSLFEWMPSRPTTKSVVLL